MHLKQDLFIPPWFYDTVVRIEEQPRGRPLIIPIGGVRNLGKTTAVIQLLRHIASKQEPDSDGIRTLRIGILREAYRDFDQIIDSFCEWFEEREPHHYARVKSGAMHGIAYKDMTVSPRIVLFERTPDLVTLILDGKESWDGTYTRILLKGYSFNKPTADARIRGENLGSGWVNEAQTLPEKPISTLMGSINRPSGSIECPVLLVDFNLPEGKDKGYDFLKTLLKHDGGAYVSEEGGGIDVYFPQMPAPYYFEESVDGDITFDGRSGFRRENQDFIKQAPHLKDLSTYAQFTLLSDDEQRRNLYGMFGRKNAGGLVYTEFDVRKHVGSVSPPLYDDRKDSLILMPIDFGYNPGVLFAYEDDGSLMIFKEFLIENINFYELLVTYLIPYMEVHLKGFYKKSDIQDQIIPIGDPSSGSRRDTMKSAQPVKVLIGETDINGDVDGNAERFRFVKARPSPCGNVIEHRINVSKLALSRPHGVYIDKDCNNLIEALSEEYVFASDGKPKKGAASLYHNIVDAFQYLCAYQAHGLPAQKAKSARQIPKGRRKRR